MRQSKKERERTTDFRSLGIVEGMTQVIEGLTRFTLTFRDWELGNSQRSGLETAKAMAIEARKERKKLYNKKTV